VTGGKRTWHSKDRGSWQVVGGGGGTGLGRTKGMEKKTEKKPVGLPATQQLALQGFSLLWEGNLRPQRGPATPIGGPRLHRRRAPGRGASRPWPQPEGAGGSAGPRTGRVGGNTKRFPGLRSIFSRGPRRGSELLGLAGAPVHVEFCPWGNRP